MTQSVHSGGQCTLEPDQAQAPRNATILLIDLVITVTRHIGRLLSHKDAWLLTLRRSAEASECSSPLNENSRCIALVREGGERSPC